MLKQSLAGEVNMLNQKHVSFQQMSASDEIHDRYETGKNACA